MKRFAAFFGGIVAIVLLVTALGASSIGPWPITGTLPVSQQGYGVAGSNGFTCTGGTVQSYLSSGGTAATSVPCNSVVISVTTAAATLYATGGTAGVALPTGTVLTLSASDLNTLKVSGGSTTAIGYLYSK